MAPRPGRAALRAFGPAVLVFLLALGAMSFWWRERVEDSIRIPIVTVVTYDSLAYYYPTFRYAFEQASRGHLPLWNPYQLCGTPFFANAQHLLLYPLNLLFWLLPTASAMKATSILHFALAVTFTFVLGTVVGLAPIAAATAGVAFALSGDIAQLVFVPHHLYGAAWIPLHVACARLVLARRGVRYAVLLGIALACQYLGGYPMYCLFSAYAVGAYLLWWLLTERPARAATIAGTAKLLLAATIALVLSAPQLVPAIELARESPRDFGALQLPSLDPFPIKSLVGAVSPLWSLMFPEQRNPFVSGHLGVVAFVLALLAFCHRARRRETFFFLLLAVVCWFLALGNYSFVYGLYVNLPTGSWFRVPGRFFVLAAFAIAMLAGIGTDFLWRDVRTGRAVAVTLGIGVVVVALCILSVSNGVRPAIPPPRYVRLTPYYLGPLCVALALYLAAPSTRLRRAIVCLTPVAVFVELFFGFINFWPIADTNPSFYQMPPAVVAYLRRTQGFDRTYIVPPQPPTNAFLAPKFVKWPLPLKSGMLYGLFTIEDRENVFPRRYARYLAYMEGGGAPLPMVVPQGSAIVTPGSEHFRLLNLMSVRFIVADEDSPFTADAGSSAFPRLFEADGVRVLANPSALPRAYVVGTAEVIADPDAVLSRLASPDFHPRETVLLEQAPAPGDVPSPETGGASSAHIVAYRPEDVAVEVDARAQGLLVLTDQYYPGWKAEVDGRPAPILRANYLFRAVPVPAGTHRVVFRYAPSWLPS